MPNVGIDAGGNVCQERQVSHHQSMSSASRPMTGYVARDRPRTADYDAPVAVCFHPSAFFR